jgi:protein-S-isoprenylcysteine O-methyltransferase Ste14
VPALSPFLPYGLLGVLAAVEIYASRVRRSDAQAQFDPSFLPILLLIGGGYGIAFNLVRPGHGGPTLGPWAAWLGAALALAGAALRVWSVAVLGRYFTYVVRVSSDQKVVETGPYRLVRHPSYSGAMLMAAGIGLALRHVWPLLIIVGSSLLAYLIRIWVEERALAQGIGEPYRDYMRRTRRLIPYLW